MKLLALLALLSPPCVLAQAAPLETCEAKLPASLRAALLTRFPGSRVAGVSDYREEDVERHMQGSNGDPCLSVASVDVDGDGLLDFAVVITDNSQHTRLTAARNVSGRKWSIVMLKDFGTEKPVRTYVDPLPAGAYTDLNATDKAPAAYLPESGRVSRFKATHPGFIAGTIEATGIGFFFTGKHWMHLQLSD